MGKCIDLDGQKFGRLTVIKRVENTKGGGSRWLCRCECDKQTIVLRGNLTSGGTKSCGCLKITHGHSLCGIRSRTYTTWNSMIQRCTNLNNPEYKNYGSRGIKVCGKWRKFEGFFQDMGKRPPNTTIDRIDNNKGYNKTNCRWITIKEQNRNKRTNRLINIGGDIRPLVEWCEIYKLCYNTVLYRIHRGWTPDEALELVPRKKKK